MTATGVKLLFNGFLNQNQRSIVHSFDILFLLSSARAIYFLKQMLQRCFSSMYSYPSKLFKQYIDSKEALSNGCFA